jgi:hypothetical protein
MDRFLPDSIARWLRCCLVLLALLVSSVGAPVVGFALIAACDVSFDGVYRCPVPQPVLDYFLPFLFLPMRLGAFMGCVWIALSVSIALALIVHVLRAIWQVTMEQL